MAADKKKGYMQMHASLPQLSSTSLHFSPQAQPTPLPSPPLELEVHGVPGHPTSFSHPLFPSISNPNSLLQEVLVESSAVLGFPLLGVLAHPSIASAHPPPLRCVAHQHQSSVIHPKVAFAALVNRILSSSIHPSNQSDGIDHCEEDVTPGQFVFLPLILTFYSSQDLLYLRLLDPSPITTEEQA